MCMCILSVHYNCNLLQNENVNREYTSTHMVADLHRPDRRTAMKVLVEKTYNFVDALWKAYMEHSMTDLR